MANASVICDGCTKELHPATKYVKNKKGVSGHWCQDCYDPTSKTAEVPRLKIVETAPVADPQIVTDENA